MFRRVAFLLKGGGVILQVIAERPDSAVSRHSVAAFSGQGRGSRFPSAKTDEGLRVSFPKKFPHLPMALRPRE